MSEPDFEAKCSGCGHSETVTQERIQQPDGLKCPSCGKLMEVGAGKKLQMIEKAGRAMGMIGMILGLFSMLRSWYNRLTR